MDIKALIFDPNAPQREIDLRALLESSGSPMAFDQFVSALAMLFHPVKELATADAIKYVMQIAALGMNPQPAAGHVFIVPQPNSKSGPYRLQEGYKFRLYLLHRAGFNVETDVVKDGEVCEMRRAAGGLIEIHHSYALDKRSAKIVASYAIAERTLADGSKQRYIGYADNQQLDKLIKTANGKGGWEGGAEAMAKKAALNRMRHTLPIDALGLSVAAIEAFDAIESDSATFVDAKPAVASAVAMSQFYGSFNITAAQIDEVEAMFEGDVDAIKDYVSTSFEPRQK